MSEIVSGGERIADLKIRVGGGSETFGVEVPLRICPLGAHIDHQHGIVTGTTVNRSVLIAAAPSDGARIEVESRDFEGRVTVDLNTPLAPADGSWGDYLRAAVSVLQQRAPVRRGFRAVIEGPLAGAGLSSSAAVLIAYLVVLARVNGIDLPDDELPVLVQRAENDYVGVACGLLDPSVMVHARPAALAVIDCSDGTVRRICSPTDRNELAIFIAYSGQPRSLAGSSFNRRVDECSQAAARLLQAAGRSVGPAPALRSVDPEMFEEFGDRLPDLLRRRADHFFGEMRRVRDGIDAWERGDLERFGALVTGSGESSIANYECGTPAMVSLFEAMVDQPGVYGARFSGAGFGGSCLALVRNDAVRDVVERVKTRYREHHPGPAESAAYHVCRSAGSFRVLEGGA